MREFFQSNLIKVFVLFSVAALISVAIYPEIFVAFKISFVLWSDYCVEYPLTFILTTFFYQGNIQLWNFFGQIPFFHTYGAIGLFKLPNVITAIAFYILEPFSRDSSQLFHHVFTWGNLMTLLFIRVVGIFLLLKIVTKNHYVLTLGSVIFAVFFCQAAFLRGTFYESYYPLGMYFIVRFFQDFRWRYLAAMFLFFIIALGSGILHSAYMYLPMHFFIIAGILWKIFFDSASRKFSWVSFWNLLQWRKMIWIVLAAVLVMGPYLYIVKFGFSDIAFDQAHSRISHMFNVQWYFHKLELGLGSPRTFFSNLSNIKPIPGYSVYLGWSFFFLVLSGLVLSRNRLKWFFTFGVIFLWLLSFPREHMNIGLIAHWINALTNPLKTIPRSYEDACQAMLPYLLMPLAVMGIEAIRELYGGKKYSGRSLCILVTMLLILLLTNITVLPIESSIYLILCTILMVLGMVWLYFKDSSRARIFIVVVTSLLVVADLFIIVYQTKTFLFLNCYRKPAVLDASPKSGMVGFDFENPSIFPFRHSYTFNFSYRDEIFLWFPLGVSSSMRHVINYAGNYTYLNGYNPRHVTFNEWANDPQMIPYLEQNKEFVFLAEAAINASPDALSRITEAGLTRKVVAVEDARRTLQLPDQWPGAITNKDREDFRFSKIEGTLDDIADQSKYHLRGDMILFWFRLPASFPGHLASSWFPEEQSYLRFLIKKEGGEWQELQQVQSELIKPYTFDIQNIKEGILTVAFSKNDFPHHGKFALFYPSNENQGVVGLWRKQFDNLGIIYRAKKDGWFVSHYPYDTKWRISVDGKPVDYYRVNKSFIGFPLVKGEHKILIQYWPHSPLRIWLLISALLTSLGLPALIFLALKWEQVDTKQVIMNKLN